MGEKVKVSCEVARAIEFRKKESRYTFDDFMKAKYNYGFAKSVDVLNEISGAKLADVLINGYEVEYSPEEILVNKYKNSLRIGSGDHANAIKFTLDTLDIKIKGINE